MFETDGQNYNILANGVASIKDIPGLVLEIGVRKGGSAQIIIDTLVKNEDINRTFVLLDPYGQIPYFAFNTWHFATDYTNSTRAQTIPEILKYGWNTNINMLFFNIEDSEFMERFSDYIPIYINKEKQKESKYAFVYYDGQHDLQSVLNATKFFVSRSVDGTCFVYDDHDMYDHIVVDEFLINNNFVLYEKEGQKISYLKRKTNV